ncbi:aldehyde dehydrogenase family protein [Desulfopila sp. IMCC35006]|uniref:L-piperidine-6-carboxylate dehydrogenase n=1 Tax=Desulfopila sp. IMCC35006 TaxID=2569542 RepID=UPI0010ACD248|nr:aldehyde dehydrogenase family protein [Desulfopila sp. IMCC35006]TKB25976.1 aldehyde dehydrogenase family protein [Desulfopila sp. IMCC35006]
MNFLDELYLEKKMAGTSTGTQWLTGKSKKQLSAVSPVDGETFAHITKATINNYEQVIEQANQAFSAWRSVPAPARGEIVRQIGLRLRDFKLPLGTLISYETGKSLQEGLGEVQEVIDVCDYCVGQSRMLYGMTTVSERPNHRLFEQYHPLGLVAIITAFNFPMAVWGWNAMLAAICGNVSIWKPSSKAPVSAIALQKIIARVLDQNNLPEGIFSLIIGDRGLVGEKILEDKRIPLVSFTGSVSAGRTAAQKVGQRLGRTILELGGNNGIIITEYADLKLAVPAVVFGAVGTSGQRCTTTRRLFIHESCFDAVKDHLYKAYASLKVGNPLLEANHMGPLIDKNGVKAYQKAVTAIVKQGGTILFGGNVLKGPEYASQCYVEPTLAEVEHDFPIVREETFAPILYLIKYSGTVENAITMHNAVDQGLSSAIFSTNQNQIEAFLCARGSDCGIANVNIGTSGAEIGGAFGGEKDTGGGRECGSDAWKSYMRRQTVTINYGSDLPLAQGIRFALED